MQRLLEAVEYWEQRIKDGFDPSSGRSRINTMKKMMSFLRGRDVDLDVVAEYMYDLVKNRAASRHSVWRFTWDIDTTPQLDHIPPYGASVLTPGVNWDVPDILAEIPDVQVRAAVMVWISTGLPYGQILDARVSDWDNGVFLGVLLPTWAAMAVNDAYDKAIAFGLTREDYLFFSAKRDDSGRVVRRKDIQTRIIYYVNRLGRQHGVDLSTAVRSFKSYRFLPRGGKYRYWNSKPGVTFGDGGMTGMIGYVVERGGELVVIAGVDGDSFSLVKPDGSSAGTASLDEVAMVSVDDRVLSVAQQALDSGVYLSHKLRKALGLDTFGHRDSAGRNQHK